MFVLYRWLRVCTFCLLWEDWSLVLQWLILVREEFASSFYFVSFNFWCKQGLFSVRLLYHCTIS